ncbi:MAG: FkbM family methyltransferase [Bacteroidales bacterium]|nr:FkbM family methyltransferase [Bacteroidales bacterium]
MKKKLVAKRMKMLIQSIIGLGFDGLKVLVLMLFGKTNRIVIAGIKYPMSLRPNSTDYDVFYQLFAKSEYTIPIHIPGFEPQLIIDAGANIGLASVFFKNAYPDAAIIAIEPDSGNFDMLKKNTAHYNAIFLEKAGLWNRETNIVVDDIFGLGEHGLIVKENDVPTENSLRAVTIDTVLKKYGFENQRIDILKIDVETSEKYIFASNYETWLSKAKVIFVELHDVLEKGCSQAFFTAIQKSIEHYSLFISGENLVVINED